MNRYWTGETMTRN